MRSWHLFIHITPFWASGGANPIIAREARRESRWVPVTRTLARRTPTLLIGLGVLAGLVALRAPLPLATRLLTAGLVVISLAISSLVTWTVPLGLVLGPLIVRERENHTWETLRTTPFPTEQIILGKARGALWRLRYGFYAGRALLVAASLVVAIFSLSTIPHTSTPNIATRSGYEACGLGLIVMAAGAGLYLIDRAQQFTLMAISALGMSASTRSMRVAVPAAYAIIFTAWLIDASIPILILALQPVQYTSLLGRVITVALFGPIPAYFSDLTLGGALVASGATLLCREVAIAFAWRITIREACRA